jgi:hypothetical protein
MVIFNQVSWASYKVSLHDKFYFSYPTKKKIQKVSAVYFKNLEKTGKIVFFGLFVMMFDIF